MAGYNGKHIKTISTATGKKNPFKDDVIIDPEGQWKYPGQVTKIPSGNITMKGIPYPVLGVDNLGNQQMMYPGIDYTFPGQSVTEYPQLKGGGWLDKYAGGGSPSVEKAKAMLEDGTANDHPLTQKQRDFFKSLIPEEEQEDFEEYRRGGPINPLMRSRSKRASTKKNIQSSINKLFLRNRDLFGPGGKNIYDPNSKYVDGGQPGWLDNYK